MTKGKPSPTVKAAKTAGDRQNGDRDAVGRQEELGLRSARHNHVCDETCEDPCSFN